MPQIAHFEFGEESLNKGDTASIQCTITKGDNPVVVEWYLNGKSIQELDGIYIHTFGKRISSLRIDSVQAQHTGEYTCKASNIAGSTYYSTFLSVNGTRHIYELKLLFIRIYSQISKYVHLKLCII